MVDEARTEDVLPAWEEDLPDTPEGVLELITVNRIEAVKVSGALVAAYGEDSASELMTGAFALGRADEGERKRLTVERLQQDVLEGIVAARHAVAAAERALVDLAKLGEVDDDAGGQVRDCLDWVDDTLRVAQATLPESEESLAVAQAALPK